LSICPFLRSFHGAIAGVVCKEAGAGQLDSMFEFAFSFGSEPVAAFDGEDRLVIDGNSRGKESAIVFA
jgi:hypothetical protein